VLFGPPGCQFRLVDAQTDRAVRDVDVDHVAFAHEADGAAVCRFWRYVADRQARGAAGEAAVGDERASLAQTLRLQIARRIQHFLNARPAFGALIADDDDVARLDLVGENGLHGGILALENPGRA